MCETIRSMVWDKTAGNEPVKNQDLSHPYVKLSADLINEEVNGEGELLDSFRKGDLAGVIDGLGDTLKVVCQMCYALDINPEELLHEVNNSNFSKFCTTKYQALESINAYADDDRYIGVHSVLVNGFYVIKGWKVGQNPDVDTPKVLKAHDYKEFDASKFIKNVGVE